MFFSFGTLGGLFAPLPWTICFMRTKGDEKKIASIRKRISSQHLVGVTKAILGWNESRFKGLLTCDETLGKMFPIFQTDSWDIFSPHEGLAYINNWVSHLAVFPTHPPVAPVSLSRTGLLIHINEFGLNFVSVSLQCSLPNYHLW